MVDYAFRTYAEINLDHFQENIKKLRELVGPDIKIMHVLKANAYGHGIRLCSRYAAPLVDCFAAATLEEALAIRSEVPDKPILVLGRLSESQVITAAEKDLTICLISVAYAQEVQRVLADNHLEIDGHLKIDTGMNRFGLRARVDEIDSAVEDAKRIYALPNIHIKGIYTHFACAGTQDPEEIAFSDGQFKAFSQVCSALKAQGYDVGLRHTASTVAFLDHPEYRLDMIRTGMFPLGQSIDEACTRRFDITPILTWYARIMDIRELQPGESVSYGRIYTATKRERIAVIPVGYADGYIRELSNAAEVIIHDQRVPIRGKLCMDYMMADVTDIPQAKIGDQVILLGRSESQWISTDYLSELVTYGVNGYITANIGLRVPRVYRYHGEVIEVVEYPY